MMWHNVKLRSWGTFYWRMFHRIFSQEFSWNGRVRVRASCSHGPGYDRSEGCDVLTEVTENWSQYDQWKCKGRSRPVAFPPRSTDLNLLCFFLWHYTRMNSEVHQNRKTATGQQLVEFLTWSRFLSRWMAMGHIQWERFLVTFVNKHAVTHNARYFCKI
jgi:hypothetical protein